MALSAPCCGFTAAICREALDATPQDHPDRARRLSNLALRLHDKYSRTRAMTDLEEAIALAREALDATPQDHPYWAVLLHNLGIQLRNRYLCTKTMEDLEEAITLCRKALEATPQDHPEWTMLLNNLGVELSKRYLQTGAIKDLEQSIDLARKAGEAALYDDPDQSLWLDNIGIQLNKRYSRTGAIKDLEEAITLSQKALEATPQDHPQRARRLNNLGGQLSNRYSRTGTMADQDKAITLAQEALKATPQDHPDWAIWLHNVGIQFNRRYARTGAMKDLEEAITFTQEAVEALPQDHPDRARWLNNLGGQLEIRYSRTGAMADLEGANSLFIKALYTEKAPVGERIRGAREYFSPPTVFDNTESAYEVAKVAVNLLPLLSSFSLQSADKQHQLQQYVGLASNAAAVALLADHGAANVLQLLETGRGVLASSLQNIRTDISPLREKHPDLAEEFENLRHRLDTPSVESRAVQSQTPISTSVITDPDSRYNANTQMEQLVNSVRSRPGFERFLMSATEEEMRDAAAYGPIVLVNVSSHRCDGIVVERSGIRALNLPNLTLDGLKEHSNGLGSVKTLAWLWDVVVSPVLDMLGFVEPPIGGGLPHLWWILTGPLTRFPLHAAGHHMKRSGKTALDRVVSSYSPSIKSIIHTRRKQHPNRESQPGSNAVLVNMQETPGQTRLSYTTKEINAVQDVCKSMGLPCNQPSAYKNDVLAALESCGILHFSGHGGTHPDALQSLLLLQDWEKDPLTVESLLDTNLSRKAPFLAYLSACGTGRIQDEQSTDESIHLTSAFQLAGFRHVIGTLWNVDDRLCVDIARLTYEFLAIKGFEDRSVSRGLHYATKKLRDEWVDRQTGSRATADTEWTGNRDIVLCVYKNQEQGLWVPYVHFGV